MPEDEEKPGEIDRDVDNGNRNLCRGIKVARGLSLDEIAEERPFRGLVSEQETERGRKRQRGTGGENGRPS